MKESPQNLLGESMPEQTWVCPKGCKYPECIHACVERMRLVAAVIDRAADVVEVARRVVGGGLPSWPGGASSPVFDLRAPIAAYDAAVEAAENGP